MSYYYFQVEGEASVLDIDTTAISITLPAINRNYTVTELFTDNAHIAGTGNFSPGQIRFTNIYKKDSTGIAWNALRKAVVDWMSIPKYKKLYFYIVTNGVTYRIQCVPTNGSEEGYSSYIISDEMTYTFQCMSAYYEKLTATTTTHTITGTVLNSINITNAGSLSVPATFSFTPSSGFSLFQVEISQGYGFRLESSFLTGQVVMYTCADSKVYINGTNILGLQSAGSTFNLAPGLNTLYIYATDGSLEVSYNERYL